MDSVKIKAFKTAFPYTVPIGASFIFLGASYGFLMVSKGFSPLYPFFMSLLIFAGSVEFVSVTMLLGSFEPVSVFWQRLCLTQGICFMPFPCSGHIMCRGGKSCILFLACVMKALP